MHDNNLKELQESNQIHHLYTLPNIFTGGILNQDLVNAKITYYGSMYTKNIPKNWLENKK